MFIRKWGSEVLVVDEVVALLVGVTDDSESFGVKLTLLIYRFPQPLGFEYPVHAVEPWLSQESFIHSTFGQILVPLLHFLSLLTRSIMVES
jgi:hypothetical protein